MLKNFSNNSDLNLSLHAKNGLVFNDVYIKKIDNDKIVFPRFYGNITSKVSDFKGFRVQSIKKAGKEFKNLLILANGDFVHCDIINKENDHFVIKKGDSEIKVQKSKLGINYEQGPTINCITLFFLCHVCIYRE